MHAVQRLFEFRIMVDVIDIFVDITSEVNRAMSLS